MGWATTGDAHRAVGNAVWHRGATTACCGQRPFPPLETATRWATHMPTSELAYQWQMKAYVLSGNRPAALRRFEQLKQMLAEELGVEPSPETAVLAQQIRQGDGGATATSPSPDPIEQPRLHIPLWDAAKSGNSCATATSKRSRVIRTSP